MILLLSRPRIRSMLVEGTLGQRELVLPFSVRVEMHRYVFGVSNLVMRKEGFHQAKTKHYPARKTKLHARLSKTLGLTWRDLSLVVLSFLDVT